MDIVYKALMLTQGGRSGSIQSDDGSFKLKLAVHTAMGGKGRFHEMRDFFEGVGSGHAAGVWEETPRDRPEFREQYERKLARQAKARKAEEMG